MTKPQQPKDRTFSKKMTFVAVWNFTVSTLLGMAWAVTDLPSIMVAYVAGLATFIGWYMQVGHSDYRISKRLPCLMDALSSLAVRRKGPPDA
ncbi:hypothetical protein [Rhizobium leguminosarum]|uniref:Uncharacterized protein n=1 Tax=Rhizobium leguminosarum TaxID=384 RepID=A0A7M3DQG1_RHILE|nr:hypothetical protein [Rhizobium leguminosarum]TAY50926.1 hypothetical protein ELH90_03985 [Rhizobium leguminosarum]